MRIAIVFAALLIPATTFAQTPDNVTTSTGKPATLAPAPVPEVAPPTAQSGQPSPVPELIAPAGTGSGAGTSSAPFSAAPASSESIPLKGDGGAGGSSATPSLTK